MLRLLPRFIRRFLFNISASIPFKIGVAIRYVLFKSLVKKCGYNVYIARWCVFKDIDELEVGDVKKYCASLLTFLNTSQNPYIGIVTSTNQFTEEAEAALKDAIAESKNLFLKNK